MRRDRPLSAVLAGAVSGAALLSACLPALTWSVVPSPSISPKVNYSEFSSVSCASATDCVAVGFDGGKTPKEGTPESAFAESWDGTRWTVLPTPAPAWRALYGVSCTSATWCMAVGVNFVDAEGDTTPLTESWNGSMWSVVPILPQASASPELLGVSCVSPTECTAVGNIIGSQGALRTLAESWNGQTWTTAATPNPGRTGDQFPADFLDGVSCPAPTACTAVGQYAYGKTGNDDAPLVESWNGTRWAAVPAPNEDNSGSLSAVSCVSTSFCAAVGTYLSGEYADNKTLLESWNGTRWTAEPATTVDSEMNGVSCASAGDCWAAGFSWAGPASTGPLRNLAEFWNGSTWSDGPVPDAGGAQRNNELEAVSCPSAQACVAVGRAGQKTLALTGTQGG